MKAMVLAAGLGTRMRPLTHVCAKPALPVLNRPLLHWTLEWLARAGVRDVVVNLHHLPRTIESVLGRGRPRGLRIRCSMEPEILGTAGGPRAVRDFFGGEPCLLVNGDVLFGLDLRELLRRHRESRALATLALRRNPDPATYSAVVTDRRGRIVSIAGRPWPGRGALSMFTGVHVLDPALLERLPTGASDSVRDLYVPLLAEGAHLAGARLQGAWYDLGRPSLYRDAQLRLLPGGRPLIDASARVSSAARLRRSVVGRRAAVAEGARVVNSVLWDGAVVERGARVEWAIVAGGAVVGAGERAERVAVVPSAALPGAVPAGGRSERHGETTWVDIT